MSYKTYTELSKLKTFEERYEYLKLNGRVASATFGSNRWVNQQFYRSAEWKSVRNQVIIRDNGNDLGIEGRPCGPYTHVQIHHINPITLEDIVNRNPKIFDLDNLICCTPNTHKAIHYGSSDLLQQEPAIRRPYDTVPWKK